MVHRKYPALGGLALCFVLLMPWPAAANGIAQEYNGGFDRGLAWRASPQNSSSGQARLRTAQHNADGDQADTNTQARQKLKRELDLIRGHLGEGQSGMPFDPPIPVRKKTASPVPDSGEAVTPRQIQQAMRKIDPEVDRALGRLLIMSFRGSQQSDNGTKTIHSLLQSGLIAGVLFGAENIQSKTQFKDLIKYLGQASPGSRPLFAVREIGGGPDSFPAIKDFEQWPSQTDVALKGEPEYAYSTYRSMGSNLAALGFNLNFGPALGLPGSGQQASASFGGNALQAGVFAKTFILGHREANMISVPIVDGSELSVRVLKTLLVSYPGTPIAATMTTEIQPFAAYQGLVRGPKFCFVTPAAGSEAADAAGYFNRGCDVLVLSSKAESPSAVRDQVAQGVMDAIQHGELTLDTLTASARRLSDLRSSVASLSDKKPPLLTAGSP